MLLAMLPTAIASTPGEKIALAHADDYINLLKDAYVIADFDTRRSAIKQQLEQCAQIHNAELDYPQSLLDEVTNLVEWPVL